MSIFSTNKLTRIKPFFTPWTYIGLGVAFSLTDLIFRKGINPYNLLFFLLAGLIEIFARKQNKVPSVLITFSVSLAIVIFVKIYVLDYKTFQSSSLEPYIHKGASLFYQPHFYKIKENDWVFIKGDCKYILCKVLSKKEQSYKLEAVSKNILFNVQENDIKGKIVYIINGNSK